MALPWMLLRVRCTGQTGRRNKIQRANLDGSHVEDLITTGLENPKRIALGIPQVLSGLRFDPDTIADQTFTVGTAVNLSLPTAIGGTPPYIYTPRTATASGTLL